MKSEEQIDFGRKRLLLRRFRRRKWRTIRWLVVVVVVVVVTINVLCCWNKWDSEKTVLPNLPTQIVDGHGLQEQIFLTLTELPLPTLNGQFPFLSFIFIPNLRVTLFKHPSLPWAQFVTLLPFNPHPPSTCPYMRPADVWSGTPTPLSASLLVWLRAWL